MTKTTKKKGHQNQQLIIIIIIIIISYTRPEHERGPFLSLINVNKYYLNGHPDIWLGRSFYSSPSSKTVILAEVPMAVNVAGLQESTCFFEILCFYGLL